MRGVGADIGAGAGLVDHLGGVADLRVVEDLHDDVAVGCLLDLGLELLEALAHGIVRRENRADAEGGFRE